MGNRRKSRWLAGVRLVEERPSWWTWELDNRWWGYDFTRGTLAIRREDQWTVVATFERIELAAGFTIGIHDGIGLAQRTNAMKLIA